MYSSYELFFMRNGRAIGLVASIVLSFLGTLFFSWVIALLFFVIFLFGHFCGYYDAAGSAHGMSD